jgi:hypothetical protein
LTAVGNSFCGSDQIDLLLIPTSVCYELAIKDASSSSELHSNWKPNVRINFGLPHSFKVTIESFIKINLLLHIFIALIFFSLTVTLHRQDFISNNKNENNMIDLKQHMRHGSSNYSSPSASPLPFLFCFLEIWRNTPIMSVHVLSMILQYRIKSKDFELKDCAQLMDEFQKKFRQHHDLAFVGDLDAITQYSLEVFSMKGFVPFSSVAVEVMKLESLMSK